MFGSLEEQQYCKAYSLMHNKCPGIAEKLNLSKWVKKATQSLRKDVTIMEQLLCQFMFYPSKKAFVVVRCLHEPGHGDSHTKCHQVLVNTKMSFTPKVVRLKIKEISLMLLLFYNFYQPNCCLKVS